VQQNLGIIQALQDAAAKRSISVRLLMPKTEQYLEEDLQTLKKTNGLDVRFFAQNSDIRTRTLIVDRAESLVMEIKEEEGEGGEEEEDGGKKVCNNGTLKEEAKVKANQQKSQEEENEKSEIVSFDKIIGLTTYSNSKSTVLSYAAMFETLWNETELHEQIRRSHNILEMANERLELQYKMQRDFINTAAHELRTPTQAILGYAEILSTEPEKSTEYVSPILRNAERLRKLTEDILDLAKIDSQTLTLNKEQFNVHSAVLPLVQDIRNQVGHLKERKVDVIWGDGDGGNGKAAGEAGFIIFADKGRIIQVISNILGNAIRFTEEGTISVKIERKDVDSSHSINGGDSVNNDSQGEVVISVKDTGRGIAFNMLPKLFSKLDTKSEKGVRGNGLGLFISKSIIEAHGGEIWAENNSDGKGATFCFSIPLDKK
jgi:two-component system, OmpR family, sensor histidine kinase VicK